MTENHTQLRWVNVPGGAFVMGSDEYYPDEVPRHRREVASFELTATPVTNAQFAAFVEATGYVTIAERPLDASDYPGVDPANLVPGSLVFTPTSGPVDLGDWRQWWAWAPGASWRHPRGPGSSVVDLEEHPVVHIAYADAQAFAAWVGGRLPTEAELEYAASGGETPAPYAWGSERDPDGALMANTWRGRFPYLNDGANGWRGTSPVGSFPANGYGLYDCIGNVWEWSSSEYTQSHAAASREPAEPLGAALLNTAAAGGCGCGCGPSDPPRSEEAVRNDGAAAAPIPQRVLKGGSHMCAPEYCLRYRPAARSPQAEDSSTTHIGFRVASDLT